ncbi:hypothetical protein PS627_01363 [Pseudomonas fluorescens]|uniref:T6SS phospholipase effector Tle1-like catalytic domain-containing protein n=1 Tax=Pseudomonas fluorescens TaxID=294 RepID=UPI001251DCF4|nr:DUF2235 domain-containing protein [Pseudomonas fluorescens]CAG8865447.1 hypothetical protein PS627_01363 [Pseudomonas fluorescens]VVP67265.1 hypothetical protein PS910_00170 [Pseudomonas fluorescens]
MGNQAVTVRIGVFFDGTGNNRDNSVQGLQSPDEAPAGIMGGSYLNAQTNVALLHALYPQDGCLYLKQYVEGIGTLSGEADSWFSQATGRWDTGVQARVAEAAQAIGRQLQALSGGDPTVVIGALEFDLFGFSRGAAAARDFANDLCGGADSLLALALKECPGLTGDRFSWDEGVVINFIGLFDTVAAIFSPLTDTNGMGDLRLGLDAGLARHTVQLVAADEQRHHFPLVGSEYDIVLPGAHADIGGGYPEVMREQVLVCKPRSNRVSVGTPVERTAAYAEVIALLEGEGPWPPARVVTWEQPLEQHRARREEPQKQVYVALYREREVLGHLSRIYLRVMRELAVEGGVPFAEVKEELPGELEAISGKLLDFALERVAGPGLNDEEARLLQARYIHASAHWNPLKGLRNSGLDLLYLDRPAEGGRVVLTA